MRLWVIVLAAVVVLVVAGSMVYETTSTKPMMPEMFMRSVVSRVSDSLAQDPSQSVDDAVGRAVVEARAHYASQRVTVWFSPYYNPDANAWVDDAMPEETVLLMCLWETETGPDGARASAYTRRPVQSAVRFTADEIEEALVGLREVELQ